MRAERVESKKCFQCGEKYACGHERKTSKQKEYLFRKVRAMHIAKYILDIAVDQVEGDLHSQSDYENEETFQTQLDGIDKDTLTQYLSIAFENL